MAVTVRFSCQYQTHCFIKNNLHWFLFTKNN